MVCLGNICRSPPAEAALREAAAAAGVAVEVDSAGTAAYHVGQPQNPPMVAAADREGLAVSGTARQVVVEDFDRFDLIVAMDTANLADLQHLARDAEDRAKLRLFRDWTDQPGLGVGRKGAREQRGHCVAVFGQNESQEHLDRRLFVKGRHGPVRRGYQSAGQMPAGSVVVS